MKHKVYITEKEIKGSPFDEIRKGTIKLRAEWPDIASLELEMSVLMKQHEAVEFTEKLEPKLLKMMNKMAEVYEKNITGDI